MPGKKKKVSHEQVLNEKILSGIVLLDLFVTGGTRRLFPAEVKNARRSVADAQTCLDNSTGTPELRARSLLSYWINLTNLYVDALLLHTQTRSNLDALKTLKSPLDQQADPLFALLNSILSDPSSPVPGDKLKRRIHPLMTAYLVSYCQTPALMGIAILQQDESQIESAREQLAIADSRFDKLVLLFQKITPILATQEHHLLPIGANQSYRQQNNLSEQFKRIKILSLSTLKTLRDYIEPPENLGQSYAHSSVNLLKDFEQNAGLSQLVKNAEMVSGRDFVTTRSLASSSSSAGRHEEESLLLSDDLNDRVIEIQYQKICQCVDTPTFDQAIISTAAVRKWVCAPERLNLMIASLTGYIQKTFPDFKRQQTLLLAGKERSFETIKLALDAHRRVTRIVLYFFRQIQSDSVLSNSPHLFALLRLDWEIRCASVGQLLCLTQSEIPNTEALWCNEIQSFYLSSFETTYPVLYKLFLNLLFDQPIPVVPGFGEQDYRYFKENIHLFKRSALLFLLHQTVSCLNQNQAEKWPKFCAWGLALLKTSQLPHPEAASPFEQGKWEKVGGVFLRLENLLQEPLKETTILAQELEKYSTLFDASLRVTDQAYAQDASITDSHDPRFRELLDVLSERCAAGSTLPDLIPELRTGLVPRLHNCFGGDPSHNLVHAMHLQNLLELCIRHGNAKEPSQELLIISMKKYSVKISNELPHWQAQIKERQTPRVRKFFELVRQDEEAGVPLNAASAIIYGQTCFQSEGFISTLNSTLQRMSQKSGSYVLGVFVQASAHSTVARSFHDKVVLTSFNLMSTGLSTVSFAEANAAYKVWDHCLPVFLQFLERQSNDPDFVVLCYQDIINIRLNEAKAYYYNGFPAEAKECYVQACALFETLANKLNDAGRLSVQQKMAGLKYEMDDMDSLPSLLGWSFEPEVCLTEHSDFMPPESGTSKRLLRFQNAWQRVQSAAESKLADAAMPGIYKAWKQHFSQTISPPVARDQLNARWLAHYQHYTDQIPFVSLSSGTAKQKLVSKAPKKDWEKLREETKIKEIEQDNKKRIERKKKRDERRRLVSLVVDPVIEEPVSSFLQEETIQAEYLDPMPSASDYLTEEAEDDDVFGVQNTAARPPVTRSWVSLVKDVIPQLDDFPPLPVYKQPASNFDLDASSSSNYTLPPGYGHPPTVQEILDTVTQAGYLAFLGGWGVQNILRGMMAFDAFIITNCEPKTLGSLLPTIVQYDEYTNECRVFAPVENIPTTIKCVPAQSAFELARSLDFTINSFFINERCELLVPVQEAHYDLATQSLRTILPAHDSFTQDVSRLWRMIRCSNQLGWSLDEDTEAVMTQWAPQLCNFSIHHFISQFKQCFIFNKQLALNNLSIFHKLGLLPWMVAKTPTGFNDRCFQFFMDSFTTLFERQEDDRFVDALALFALLNKSDSLMDYQRQISEWMASFEVGDYNSRVLQSLIDTLPDRVKHYYNQSPMLTFNAYAEPFIPYAGSRYGLFLANPQSVNVSCSSNNVEWPGEQRPFFPD